MTSAPNGNRQILRWIAVPMFLSLTAIFAQAQSCAPETSDQFVLTTRPDVVRQTFLFHSDSLDPWVRPEAGSEFVGDDLMLTGLEKSVWIRLEAGAGPFAAGEVTRADNWNFETFSQDLQQRAGIPERPTAERVAVAEFAWNDSRPREGAAAIPEPSATLLMLPAAMLLLRRRRKWIWR
jgi:hypothetical protein